MELTTIVNFVYAIFGIGIIIFIHELGHFLLAKRVGVRVEKFSLGFDPSIRGRRLCLLSFRRGETEYTIGAIPFGGYVKMAGETAMERKDHPDRKPRSDELVGKPPGARAMVFAAGAVFNVISAFLFFILAFKIGVSFTAPVVGRVEPGRPAWEAGMRAGDRIVAIDGKNVDDFHEIAIASALGDPGRPRTFQVRRGAELLEPMTIVPQWTPEQGFHTIGVVPDLDPEVKKVEKGSAAARAGLREGDRLMGFRAGGAFVPGPLGLSFLGEYLQFHPGAEFELGLERPGEPTRWVPVHLEEKRSGEPKPMLGVTLSADLVEKIRPGAAALKAFSPGDRLRSVGGKPLVSLDWISVMDEVGLKGPAEIELESATGQVRKVTVDAAELILWSLDRDVDWAPERLRIARISDKSPFAGVLAAGDRVAAVGTTPVFDPEGFLKAARSAGERMTIWYRRGGEVRSAEVRAERGGVSDLLIDWSLPPLRVLPDRAAALGGMKSGSVVEEVGGRPVRTWDDLLKAVNEAPGKLARVKWIPPEGGTREAVLNLLAGARNESYEDVSLGTITFNYRQTQVQAGIFDSFALGAKRTVVVAEHVFLTLKGLLSRQVSAKNLAGPVGIINLIYNVSEYGLGTLIYYLALISVNLGLFNLLPFPILDGGHLLFLAIEKIKGSPVDVRIQEVATTVAFFLIIGLALFVTYNDIRRLFGM
jgi:regulator of sigma E protease